VIGVAVALTPQLKGCFGHGYDRAYPLFATCSKPDGTTTIEVLWPWETR
jgi:hypothetical protein